MIHTIYCTIRCVQMWFILIADASYIKATDVLIIKGGYDNSIIRVVWIQVKYTIVDAGYIHIFSYSTHETQETSKYSIWMIILHKQFQFNSRSFYFTRQNIAKDSNKTSRHWRYKDISTASPAGAWPESKSSEIIHEIRFDIC